MMRKNIKECNNVKRVIIRLYRVTNLEEQIKNKL